MASFEEERLTVRKTAEGWEVVQFKAQGINKGETVLAALCGGNMGKALAITVLQKAAEMTMISNIKIED